MRLFAWMCRWIGHNWQMEFHPGHGLRWFFVCSRCGKKQGDMP